MTADTTTAIPFAPLPMPKSIESGYFVFTPMPSLYCRFNCPHCYLTKEQRRDRLLMPLADFERACRSIDAWYRERALPHVTIVCYWYGGEPTDMGMEYLSGAMDIANRIFAPEHNYTTIHSVLSSLVAVDDAWFALFRRYCGGQIGTSYDGVMRGTGYVRRWETRVRAAREYGLEVVTVSAVNRCLCDSGGAAVMDYLQRLRVNQCAFLPFMWNRANDATQSRWNVTMREYNDFMIALSQRWLQLAEDGERPPIIIPLERIFALWGLENIAAQTLYLLPRGDFALADYPPHSWQEFLRPFGNIFDNTFGEILQSPARRTFLRRQLLRNHNPECLSCDHADRCSMEYWKRNRPGDECFGGKRYLEWALAHQQRLLPHIHPRGALFF